MTETERKLWSLLRRKQLEVRFRRQVALGPYVADFACLQPKIIIELDGSQHLQKKNADHDWARDAFLGKQGFQIFRFSDRELLTNPEGVIKVIYGYVHKDEKAIDPSLVLPSRGRDKILGEGAVEPRRKFIEENAKYVRNLDV